MAFLSGLTATVGKWMRAGQYNRLVDNAEWVQEQWDVGHNFDPILGTGTHRGAWSAPLVLFTTTGASLFCAVWIDNTGTPKRLRVKFAASRAACLPSSEDDATSFVIVLTRDYSLFTNDLLTGAPDLGSVEVDGPPTLEIAFTASFSNNEMRLQPEVEIEASDAVVQDDQEMKVQPSTDIGFTLSVHDDGAP